MIRIDTSRYIATNERNLAHKATARRGIQRAVAYGNLPVAVVINTAILIIQLFGNQIILIAPINHPRATFARCTLIRRTITMRKKYLVVVKRSDL